IRELALVLHADVFVSSIESDCTAARALDESFRIGANNSGNRGRHVAPLDGQYDCPGHGQRTQRENDLCPMLPAHAVRGYVQLSCVRASDSDSSTNVSPPNAFCSSEKATSSAARCSVR